MRRTEWTGAGPSFVIASGMVMAMWAATHGGSQAVRMLSGVAVLGVATLVADVWHQRQRGRRVRPSWGTFFLVAGFGGASVILMDGDAGVLRTLIPAFGISSWVMLQNRKVSAGICGPIATNKGTRVEQGVSDVL